MKSKDEGRKKAAFAAVLLISALMLSWLIYMQTGIKKPSGISSDAPGTSGASALSPVDEISVLHLFDITAIFGKTFTCDVGGGVTQAFVIRDATHICWYNYKDGEQIAAFTEDFTYNPEGSAFDFSGDSQPVAFTKSGDAITIGAVQYRLSDMVIEGEPGTEGG
jgi:hypothetical protein